MEAKHRPQGGERWSQAQATKPSARLRAARAMPNWISARGSAVPPPPPPPPEDSPLIEPEYEVIEFSTQQMYSNQPVIRGKEVRDIEKKRCDLCGSSALAVRCMQCSQQNFCYSCDEMYHRHPKRQFHVRKELEGAGLPPLPPKGEPQPPPVPPPRRNKRATPRLQHLPNPLPSVPPSPQISQREPMSSKTGFMGSLKRMIGGRQLPIVPHGIDQQNQFPINSSIMGFQDPMNCNGCQNWLELQRGSRSGSFNALNHPGFGQMMQTQSTAHLNCPSCQRHGVWNPWPPAGTWHSSAFLNHCPPKEKWKDSDSDSDSGWHRERQRRFSTLSARIPRSHAFDDTQSMRGGRRTEAESSSSKGSRRKDFDTLSSHGGSRRQHFDTMSMRGERRSNFENFSTRSQRKFSDVQNLRYTDNRRDGRFKDSDSSGKESDNFVLGRQSRRTMSDVEDMRTIRKNSETIPSKQMKNEESRHFRSQTKRNDKLAESGRKGSLNNRHDSSQEENDIGIKYAEESESGIDEKAVDGFEAEKIKEEEELGPIPDTEWECKHCTFINQGGTRVCTVCCKTTAKPKLCKPSTPPAPPTVEFKKKLILDDRTPNGTSPKHTKDLEEKRGAPNPDPNRLLTSKGTSPPPQSISTQTYEEGGRKLKRASSLADYGDWKAPQRSASRQSLPSDTQSLPLTPPRSKSPDQQKFEINRRPSDQFSQRSLKRAGSQPPEYISSLVQKQVKQGLEMVKLLREAEENQFSAEDLAVALLHCGDGDPIKWLQENWRNMIDTVVTLGTNYGQERKENIVGTISASEAREALRAHDGNVWAAVTQCVEQRQRKYAELLSRGNFSREDIVTVLTANHGNLEDAYKELNKNQLKPFLMRIWGPPQGADNDDGDITKLAHGELDGQGGKNSEEVSVDLSIESNYDRIRNWLDHVNVNNKSRFSQSMLQLNLTGNNHSELEWKFQTNYKTSDFSKNHQTSDVNRYLTYLYNANAQSLRIDNKSMYGSVKNFLTETKLSSDSEPLYEPKLKSGNISHLTKSDTRNEHLNNEIETITIKLKPIVVEVDNDDDRSAESESNQEENNTDNQTKMGLNSEGCIKDNVVTERNHNERHDVEHNVLKSRTGSEKFSFSNDVSNIRLEISSSNSETSSGSFESLHSGNNEDQLIYENMNSKNLGIQSGSSINIYENIERINTGKTRAEEETDSSISDENYEIFAESNKDSLNEQYSDYHKNIISEPIISFSFNDDQDTLLPLSKLNNQISKCEVTPKLIKNTQLEKMDKESENSEIYSNDEETKSSNSTQESMREEFVMVETHGFMRISPLKMNSTPLLSEEYEFHNENEVCTNIISTKISPQQIKSITETGISDEENNSIPDDKDNGTCVLSSASKETEEINRRDGNVTTFLDLPENANVDKENCASLMPSPKVYDEGSKEYSEEIENNIEESILPPDTILETRSIGEVECHISETNSDKDVSSIQTDSEREILFNCVQNNSSTETENNTSNNNVFNSSHTELIDLLKKSLCKEDVVEKLVHTLFANVLKVSNGAQNLEELGIFQNLGKKENIPKEREEAFEKSVPNTEFISKSVSVLENEQKLDLKQEIIIPSVILAEGEGTSEEINFEKDIDEISHNVNSENTFCEPNETKNTLFQREARRLLAEGLVATYEQAEIALQLKELNLDEDDGIILAAANDCGSLEAAIAFLQQECLLCANKCTVKQMISMLQCEHKCCLDCASNYFTLQITERNISDCICPFCKEPNILQLEEDKVLTYFSNLDILLKGLVKENIHELFQRKLRDRTLMQDPNFKWCVKCSSGYIANPRQKRLMCPDCKAITCAKCMKPWEKEHEKMTCDEFKVWLEHNDPENQLARHLDENGITCPNCQSKYLLAKGGCMHLICPHCKHEFCSGCSKPFLMGKKCSVSDYCEKLGLHSHHPRNCLFYLRDKEPEELERLLEDNKINYKNEEPADTKCCNIQLLKETPEGLMEGLCGHPTHKAGLCRKHYIEKLSRLIRQSMVETIPILDEDDLETVVRRSGRKPPFNPYGTPKTHYVESLVTVIRNNRVDPVMLLDYGEALQELRRHGKEPPERTAGMSEYNHRQICLKVIADEIALD